MNDGLARPLSAGFLVLAVLRYGLHGLLGRLIGQPLLP